MFEKILKFQTYLGHVSNGRETNGWMRILE